MRLVLRNGEDFVPFSHLAVVLVGKDVIQLLAKGIAVVHSHRHLLILIRVGSILRSKQQIFLCLLLLLLNIVQGILWLKLLVFEHHGGKELVLIQHTLLLLLILALLCHTDAIGQALRAIEVIIPKLFIVP